MYSRDELFLCSLECYFGIYTKITLERALKQFVTRVHTLFSILCMYLILLIGNLYGVSSHVAAYAHPCQFVSSCLWLNHVIAHYDVIKWKHFPVTGPLCEEFTGHRWIPLIKASDPGLMFFFICAWLNDWLNNRVAGDLRRHRVHNDVTVNCSIARLRLKNDIL